MSNNSPFIANFAITPRAEAASILEKASYLVSAESSVEKDGTHSISAGLRRVSETGSIITKALDDPTNDEPGDR